MFQQKRLTACACVFERQRQSVCLGSEGMSGGKSGINVCLCTLRMCVRECARARLGMVVMSCMLVCVCRQLRARLSAWYSANTPNAGWSQMSVCAVQVAWQHVEVERTR